MTRRLSLDEVRTRVKRLPGLPRVVFELESALQSETGTADRVVRLVASDAGLTAMALKLANSSFYGASGRVTSLREAVQILGLQTLSTAVMTAAVMARLQPPASTAHDADAAWRHALGTALCAQRLAESRGVDACTAYTAGLLHDIGELAIATCFPEAHAETNAWAARHDVPAADAERELLGVDHADVGAVLAVHWHFAPAVVDTLRLHHAMPAHRRDMLLDVVHVADNIVHALDLSGTPDEMVPPICLDAWARVRPAPEELHGVFERIEGRLAKLDLGSFR